MARRIGFMGPWRGPKYELTLPRHAGSLHFVTWPKTDTAEFFVRDPDGSVAHFWTGDIDGLAPHLRELGLLKHAPGGDEHA